MNQFAFSSSAEHVNMPLDCRTLKLTIKFHMLSQIKTLELGYELMRFAYEQFSDCAVFDWFLDGKRNRSKIILDSIYQAVPRDTGLSVGFSAYFQSPVISNVSALRKYERDIQRVNPEYAYGWNAGFLESIDYPKYFNSIFPEGKTSNEEIVKRIFNIFHEADKYYRSFHSFADLGGGFYSHQYRNHPGYYYGTGSIWISLFSAGCSTANIADTYAAFAQSVSERFINLNASIGIQPFRTNESPYMRYFGNHVAMDGTHCENRCLASEWYPYYYFCDVAWINIISPLTRTLLKLEQESMDLQECTIKGLKSGGLIVKASNSVLGFDIKTAKNVKNAIVDALYPGISTVPLRTLFPHQGHEPIYWECPRSDWAILPLDEDEIRVVGTELLYISRNYMTYE